jgi:hypothetical protein
MKMRLKMGNWFSGHVEIDFKGSPEEWEKAIKHINVEM